MTEYFTDAIAAWLQEVIREEEEPQLPLDEHKELVEVYW